jgi:hypothetical protein
MHSPGISITCVSCRLVRHLRNIKMHTTCAVLASSELSHLLLLRLQLLHRRTHAGCAEVCRCARLLSWRRCCYSVHVRASQHTPAQHGQPRAVHTTRRSPHTGLHLLYKLPPHPASLVNCVTHTSVPLGNSDRSQQRPSSPGPVLETGPISARCTQRLCLLMPTAA